MHKHTLWACVASSRKCMPSEFAEGILMNFHVHFIFYKSNLKVFTAHTFSNRIHLSKQPFFFVIKLSSRTSKSELTSLSHRWLNYLMSCYSSSMKSENISHVWHFWDLSTCITSSIVWTCCAFYSLQFISLTFIAFISVLFLSL